MGKLLVPFMFLVFLVGWLHPRNNKHMTTDPAAVGLLLLLVAGVGLLVVLWGIWRGLR